ncbi:putative bifunctional diguanylate cyclase/phosphodiesterase [Noviherbaspirillum cavernae]|nr:bifunctional diguanylate cyclase/phosphodiesterase [Noviherbaspirillum cavernae]
MRTPLAKDSSMGTRHSWLAAGLFAVLFLISLVIGYNVYVPLVDEQRRQLHDALDHIADTQNAAVSAWIRERVGDAMVFSSGRFFGETAAAWLARGAPDDDARRQMLEQLKAIHTTYNYLEVALLDGHGTVRISTQATPLQLDAVAAETMQHALRSSSILVSPFHAIPVSPGTEQTENVVDIIAPLLSIDEEQIDTPAVLLLRARARTDVAPFAHTPPIMGSVTEVLLTEIRGEQVVISSSNLQASHFGKINVLPVSPSELMASAKSHDGSFAMDDASGTPLIAMARQVSRMPWYLVTVINENAIVASVRRMTWLLVGATAGILSLLGIAVLLWWREKEGQMRLQALQEKTERQLLQRQYDYLSKYANDMIILADAGDCIIDVNDKTLQALGRHRADMIGRPVQDLFLPQCKHVLQQAAAKLLREGMALFEVTQQQADGTLMPVEVSARAIDFEGKRFVQLICRDISERKQSELALLESQNRLNSILESILDIVWSVSPDFSRLNYINQSIEQITGYPVSAFETDPRRWLTMIHEDDRPHVEEALHALGPDHAACEAEFRIRRQDRELRWLHCRAHLVVDADGTPQRIDGVATDVTQRKATEQQVEMLAYYDNVTRLPNRTLLYDRLAQATHMAMRSEKKVALLFMDLDNFKNVNDSLGHDIGDMLLRAIAERLSQCVREEDTVARIGGDEFLIVLPDIDRGEQAAAVAEKILAATARPFILKEQQIYSTISIGISVFPDDGKETQELIKHADTALYQAKGQGRDRYQFFTRELNLQIIRSTNIERQLRHAIENDALSLWYQPQIDTKEGRLIGAEALLRWRHAGREVLSPVEFIPVAEERGLISKMGEWAIREACAQCRRWQLEGLHPIPIAVNVSPIQFQQKGFASLVTGILRESQLDPTYLELEITESSIMRRASLVAELAMNLRDVGVGISIDDFGTGYSSLSYLKQIPIDKIKIDRSFIAAMLTHGDDEAITYAIINLARSLNMRVIAEGVETKAQLDRLRLFGCNEVQGHYYSKAVSAETFRDFLANQNMFSEVA